MVGTRWGRLQTLVLVSCLSACGAEVSTGTVEAGSSGAAAQQESAESAQAASTEAACDEIVTTTVPPVGQSPVPPPSLATTTTGPDRRPGTPPSSPPNVQPDAVQPPSDGSSTTAAGAPAGTSARVEESGRFTPAPVGRGFSGGKCPRQTLPPFLPAFGSNIKIGNLNFFAIADEGTSAKWLSEPGWHAKFIVTEGDPSNPASQRGVLLVTDARSSTAPVDLESAVRSGFPNAVVRDRRPTRVLLNNRQADNRNPSGSVERRESGGRALWLTLSAVSDNAVDEINSSDLSPLLSA